MSLLKTKLLFNASRSFTTTTVRAAYWNKDWKPGKYPTTEEERRAAAKKYGLLPEEYKPIPDDGEGAGDYPGFKPLAADSRDPFYPWDYPEYRRNYGEPLHINENIHGLDRWNVNQRYKYSTAQKTSMFLGVISISYLLMYLGNDACFNPAAQQHLPAPGVKHYTYE